MSTDLTVTVSALDRLNKSLTRSSIDEAVNAARRSMLLLDCSSSMGWMIVATHERRIDALRKVVAELVKTHPVPIGVFGPTGSQVVLIDPSCIPEPGGGTPMHDAIDFGTYQGANHLVIVTDGEPQSADQAFAAARRFGGPIDVFFVGNKGEGGEEFARSLAKLTGGQFGVSDMSGDGAKQLAGKITLLLGDGSGL